MMAVVLLVARRVANGMTLLIVGLLFGYLTSAFVSVLLYFSIPERVRRTSTGHSAVSAA